MRDNDSGQAVPLRTTHLQVLQLLAHTGRVPISHIVSKDWIIVSRLVPGPDSVDCACSSAAACPRATSRQHIMPVMNHIAQLHESINTLSCIGSGTTLMQTTLVTPIIKFQTVTNHVQHLQVLQPLVHTGKSMYKSHVTWQAMHGSLSSGRLTRSMGSGTTRLVVQQQQHDMPWITSRQVLLSGP